MILVCRMLLFLISITLFDSFDDGGFTFGGYDLVMKAYDLLAVKEKYRFGTYGDAMLII